MVKEVLISVAGVVVVAAIFAAVKYQMSKKESGEEVEKIFVDELNMGEIKVWFKDKLLSEAHKGVIFYPTKENLSKWKIKASDNNNLLIQMVYDVETDSVVSYREITFMELSEKLEALIDSSEGTLIINK